MQAMVPSSGSGADSMENFIKHQMMAILQPFADHVQELDAHLTKLAEDLHQTDLNVTSTQKGLESTNGNVLEMRNGLKKTNARLTTVREGLEKCNHNNQLLQQGLEGTNSNVQRINSSLESTIGAVQELQRGLKEADTDIVMLQSDMKKTNEHIDHTVMQGLDRTNGALSDLTTNFTNQCSNIEALKHEIDLRNQFLQDTRHTLEQNNVRTTVLQKHFEELSKQDKELSAKLQDTCHQLTKTQRGLQATDTDVAKLYQALEQNDAATHALQQGHAATSQSLVNLTRAHEKDLANIVFLQKDLVKAHQQLADTENNLSKTTSLANNLHNGLHKTDGELHKTALQLDGLDLKHHALQDSFEKTSGTVGDLMRGHRKAVSNVEILQHELEKTNETLTTTRNHLEESRMDLHAVKDNLSKTNGTMQKLDLGVEFQHACFAGLRKGFQETQLSTKPTMLPKLTQGNGDVKASQSILGPKTKFGALPDGAGSLTAR